MGTYNSSLYFIKIRDDQSFDKLGEFIFCEPNFDKKLSIPNSIVIKQNENGDFMLLVGLRSGKLSYLRLDMDLILKGPNFLSFCISISQSTSLGYTPVSIINSNSNFPIIAFSDRVSCITLKGYTFTLSNIILDQVQFNVVKYHR